MKKRINWKRILEDTLFEPIWHFNGKDTSFLKYPNVESTLIRIYVKAYNEMAEKSEDIYSKVNTQWNEMLDSGEITDNSIEAYYAFFTNKVNAQMVDILKNVPKDIFNFMDFFLDPDHECAFVGKVKTMDLTMYFTIKPYKKEENYVQVD